MSLFTFPKEYDVLVCGAGHAGVEAAMAASRLGCQTAILTQNLDSISQMSCNPAIGGLAKGHMVREIDALGGIMALNTDATGIQFRMLNAGKGPSVQAPRAQADKKAYQFRMKWLIENQPNLDLHQGNAAEILVEGEQVVGVRTSLGVIYRAKSVVICSGTFMRGLLHVGLQNQSGGRMGDSISTLSDSLLALGFDVKRFKTGTPCRINGRSIDLTHLEPQHGNNPPPCFSYLSGTMDEDALPTGPGSGLPDGGQPLFTLNHWKPEMFHVEQIPCWITYTNTKTHDIIRANLDKSPMYCGRIEGVGPRYCPSIEDKVVRFADKDRHQSPRAGTPANSTSMECPPRSPSRCKSTSFVRSRGLKKPRLSVPVMRWSTITVPLPSFRPRWKPSASLAFTSPARSMAPRATRKLRPRASWQESMLR